MAYIFMDYLNLLEHGELVSYHGKGVMCVRLNYGLTCDKALFLNLSAIHCPKISM